MAAWQQIPYVEPAFKRAGSWLICIAGAQFVLMLGYSLYRNVGHVDFTSVVFILLGFGVWRGKLGAARWALGLLAIFTTVGAALVLALLFDGSNVRLLGEPVSRAWRLPTAIMLLSYMLLCTWPIWLLWRIHCEERRREAKWQRLRTDRLFPET